MALGQLGRAAKASIPAVQQALANPNFHAPAEAACALWQISGDPTASLPVLLAELKDHNAPWEAAEAFARLGPTAKVAVPDLIKLLDSPDVETKLYTAAALAELGPDAKAAIPTLEKLAESEDEEVREIAREAIGQLEAIPP
jgi:HEAT repeat protein